MPFSKHDHHNLAYHCLCNIAIGDAFGESFFGPTDLMHKAIAAREIPDTSWEFTDDTIMSASVYATLRSFNKIDSDFLARAFASNYASDPRRGYGATAGRMLRDPEFPKKWRAIAAEAFDGMGSMGNGAAMRSGPIGACFYDDLERVKVEARASAIVTHANKEAIVGAQAVAVATALATRVSLDKTNFSPSEFIAAIVEELDDTDIRAKINKSLSVPYSYTIDTVRTVLGDGTKMLAQDTVPFAIWCAAHNLLNFEEALWKSVSMLGDRDTICAIVAGIVGMSTEPSNVPQGWLDAVEDIQKGGWLGQ